MTKEQFTAKGTEMSAKAGVLDGLHSYFRLHATRLHQVCEMFNLFKPLGDVLEIGPFYGYMPFILRPHSSSYHVLEGNDPAVHALEPLYREYSVQMQYVDFFDLFGPIQSAPHKLPLADSAYDTILCWETMEHFNFNPVKFVRELHRVLKPGGRVCITVPNKASFQGIVALMFGRGEKELIHKFYRFEDYESNGKKAFYGFHWREYSPPELSLLFNRCGFKVQTCGSFVAFQEHGPTGTGRKFARALSRAGSAVLPRFGTNVYLTATR
jgi:SAM-dependent methyltransferase